MTTPDFAQYLRDRGLISDALLLEVRTVATAGRIPLGRLLLESQAMNVRQVMKVLALQAEAPGLRFGELSIREGYITTSQLEAALVRQSTARRHQIDVLRDMRLMTPFELEALVMDYVGFLELRIAEDEGAVAAKSGRVRCAFGFHDLWHRLFGADLEAHPASVTAPAHGQGAEGGPGSLSRRSERGRSRRFVGWITRRSPRDRDCSSVGCGSSASSKTPFRCVDCDVPVGTCTTIAAVRPISTARAYTRASGPRASLR